MKCKERYPDVSRRWSFPSCALAAPLLFCCSQLSKVFFVVVRTGVLRERLPLRGPRCWEFVPSGAPVPAPAPLSSRPSPPLRSPPSSASLLFVATARKLVTLPLFLFPSLVPRWL